MGGERCVDAILDVGRGRVLDRHRHSNTIVALSVASGLGTEGTTTIICSASNDKTVRASFPEGGMQVRICNTYSHSVYHGTRVAKYENMNTLTNDIISRPETRHRNSHTVCLLSHRIYYSTLRRSSSFRARPHAPLSVSRCSKKQTRHNF